MFISKQAKPGDPLGPCSDSNKNYQVPSLERFKTSVKRFQFKHDCKIPKEFLIKKIPGEKKMTKFEFSNYVSV